MDVFRVCEVSRRRTSDPFNQRAAQPYSDWTVSSFLEYHLQTIVLRLVCGSLVIFLRHMASSCFRGVSTPITERVQSSELCLYRVTQHGIPSNTSDHHQARRFISEPSGVSLEGSHTTYLDAHQDISIVHWGQSKYRNRFMLQVPGMGYPCALFLAFREIIHTSQPENRAKTVG